MKLIFIKYISILIYGFLLCSCSMPVTEPDFSLRTVKLNIIDEETGEPVPGINVYQVFNSQIHGGCWSFVTHLEPTDTKYWLRSAKSNESGTVIFDQQIYNFTCDEHPGTEYLVINLDVKSNFSKEHKSKSNIDNKAMSLSGLIFTSLDSESEKLITINPRYRGVLIYGSAFKKENIDDWWHGEQKKFDVHLNVEGFTGGPQEFIVKLRRSVKE